MKPIFVTPHLQLVDGRLKKNGHPFVLRDTDDVKEFVIGTLSNVTAVLALAFPDSIRLLPYNGKTEVGSVVGDYSWSALEFLHREGTDSHPFGKRVLAWVHLAKLVLKMKPSIRPSEESVAVLEFLTGNEARDAMCSSRKLWEQIQEWNRWRNSTEALMSELTGEGRRTKPSPPSWSLILPWPEELGVRPDTDDSLKDLVLSLGSDIFVREAKVGFRFGATQVEISAAQPWVQDWMDKLPGSEGFAEAGFRGNDSYDIRATRTDTKSGPFYVFRPLSRFGTGLTTAFFQSLT